MADSSELEHLIMPQPKDLDIYKGLITTPDEELIENKVQPAVIDRLHRIRGIYLYFVSHPTASEKEIFQRLTSGGLPGMAPVKRSQAFADMSIARYLIGNFELASKQFARWKINQELEEDIKKARAQQDYKAVAALQKVRVANFRTDKEDELDLVYDNIVPPDLRASSDPSAFGFESQKALQTEIREMEKQLAPGGEYIDYQVVETNTEDE